MGQFSYKNTNTPNRHISSFGNFLQIIKKDLLTAFIMSTVAEKIVPKLKAEEEEEEELVDPQVEIKERCTTEYCQKYVDKLEECNSRVQGKSKTTETCYEGVLDFYHCMDHHASPETF